MSTPAPVLDRNVVVAQKERRQAGDVLQLLEGHSERLRVGAETHVRPLPSELADILAIVVEVMANGGTVTIGSLPDELSTSVAADQLGVSRPTLMKFIKNGELPAHMVGSHHRVKLSDVQNFKRQRLEAQRKAFEELRDLEDELEDSQN